MCITQESLIDSRFKVLATGLQEQVNELKDKVIRLEATNSQEKSKNQHHVAGIQKRQARQSASTCASSSLLCNYYYPDHPDARPSKKAAKIGMPTSCKDLQLLGHRLNGFYSVKTSHLEQGTSMIETVYCNFQSAFESDSNG